MILIVTNRDDLTTDFVVLELQDRKVPFLRLNTEEFSLGASLAWAPLMSRIGEISHPTKGRFPLASINSVWFRRPMTPTTDLADERAETFAKAEWRAVLDNLWASLQSAFWVSPPANISAASLKIPQLQIAQELGLKVPATLISNDADELLSFFDNHGGNVIGKVLHAQTPTVTSNSYLIYTSRVAREDIVPEGLATPLLIQEYVEKAREIRVTIVGDSVFAVALDSQAVPEGVVDWRRATLKLAHEPTTLPCSVSAQLKQLMRRYGLQFAAIDLILTPENEFVFLELNPNGQWAWLQQLTGVEIREALVDLLIEADVKRNHQ